MMTFAEERAEVLTSLDKNKIIDFYKQYDIKMPEDENIFWAGIHKAICALWEVRDKNITKESYIKSKKWLKEHDFKEIIW